MKDIANLNKAVVIAFYEAFCSADLKAFDTLLASNWVNHPADPGRENTITGFKGGVQDFHEAFKDFRIQRDALIAEGNLVVCRITMSGIHLGALGDWQPSGLPVIFHGMDMHRLEGGRLVETWHFERTT